VCEGYDRGMRTHRSIAAVLTGGLVAAATLFAAPAAEAAPGYQYFEVSPSGLPAALRS